MWFHSVYNGLRNKHLPAFIYRPRTALDNASVSQVTFLVPLLTSLVWRGQGLNPRMRECEDWSESSLGAHVWRYVSWRCAPIFPGPFQTHVCTLRSYPQPSPPLLLSHIHHAKVHRFLSSQNIFLCLGLKHFFFFTKAKHWDRTTGIGVMFFIYFFYFIFFFFFD